MAVQSLDQAIIALAEMVDHEMHRQHQLRTAEEEDPAHALEHQLKDLQQLILRKKRHRLNHLNRLCSQAKSQINARIRRLAQELFEIYPIIEFPDRRGYSICDIYLPDSNHLGHDPNMINVAIGYIGHLLIMLGDILDIALRFPIRHFGSKSTIYCNRSNHNYPLYIDSNKSRESFSYGLSLLNLDILQIRTLYGLTTNDPGETLANLHQLKVVLVKDE